MRALAILFMVILALPPAYADEIWLITSPKTLVKNLSPKRLENIFLRKTLLNEAGGSWIPLNLNPDDPIRQAFSETLLNRKPEAMEAYWNEQYFNGITPPYVVASEEAMLRFVSGTQGAIGYILPCHWDKRVQTVYKLTTKLDVKPFCKK